jgi:tetratricopeptide (TPR) repeat protein
MKIAASRRWWLALLTGVLVLAVGVVVWWRAPRFAAPQIELKDLDPAVAQVLSNLLTDVQAQPDSARAWGRLGSALMHHEFVQETDAAFYRAAQLDSQEPRWPYLLALLRMQTQPRAALPLLERAVELAPEIPDAPRLRLGELYFGLGRMVEAERCFEVLLRTKPDHGAAALGLARVRNQQGRFSECSNLVTLFLGNPHVAREMLTLMAAVKLSAGDREGAASAARQRRGMPPDAPWPDPWWRETLEWRVGRKARLADASALLDAGEIHQAVDALRGVARDYPQDDEVWYLLGWGLNQQQKFAEAELALREHLRRLPESPKGHAQLGVSLLNLRRYSEASDVLAAGVKLKPTWRELHSNLGFAAVQLGRETEAIGHFREALVCDPGYAATYLSLSELLGRRGERAEARRMAGAALNLEPENSRAAAMVQRWATP